MNHESLIELMADPQWRISNLYKIVDKRAQVVTFVPNEAQQSLFDNLWFRNVIPKARKRGISTGIQIAMLDACLFTDNFEGCVIAQDRDTAEDIFGKVKFAYRNLPPALLEMRPLVNDRADELSFSNGSKISVVTSARGGTPQWLHISEYGKICAKNPERAAEIMTGSLPSVPEDGVIFIESTAEGLEGDFYEKVQEAIRVKQSNIDLSKMQYKLHFYSWWDADEYQDDECFIGPKDTERFDEIEKLIGRPINNRRRSWYVQKRRAEFNDDEKMMRQEYPSTVEDCFYVSQEGKYLSQQMALARAQDRICKLPLLQSIPCNTFWDIGSTDGTAIWVHQRVGPENRFVRFFECWDKPYAEATTWLQGLGLTFGVHYLPHDAEHKRQGKNENKSPQEMLQELMPGQKFEVVDRIPHFIWGIQRLRDEFETYYFDIDHCADGIKHLDLYAKTWNRRGYWNDDAPDKSTGHSEAADALRQHAQGYQSTNAWGDYGKKKAETQMTQYARSSRTKSSNYEHIV